MKKLLYVLTALCLLAGFFASCEKPNETNEKETPFDPDYTAEADYTVSAFGLNMEMVYVEGGTFEMGATAEQGDDVWSNVKPVHKVTLDGFHIGKYEVTQAQWKAVMGTTIEQQRDKVAEYAGGTLWLLCGEGDDYPMYYICWEDVEEFCKKLSQMTGKTYRLPTEAEWEYAARGGNKSQHYKYAGSNDIEEVAWYNGNSYNLGSEHPDYGTHRVGMKKANELGLYDMSGNVLECCSDWYEGNYYSSSPAVNPQGPSSGFIRMPRGGCWSFGAQRCSVSFRDGWNPDHRSSDLGFRVACSAE